MLWTENEKRNQNQPESQNVVFRNIWIFSKIKQQIIYTATKFQSTKHKISFKKKYVLWQKEEVGAHFI